MAREMQLSSYSRLFLIDGRASPALTPIYRGLSKAGALDWPQGDVTLVRRPGAKYGSFQVIGQVVGEQGVPSLPITTLFNSQGASRMLALTRRGCNFDVQVHLGECQDPRDFNRGWDKVLLLESARVTSYGLGETGALNPSENAVVNEEVPVTGEDYLEILPMSFGAKAATQVVREVVDVQVCDTEACGECETTSDGCQKVFAIVKSSDASPGLPSEVVFTDDGGLTWSDTIIDTLAVTEDPNGADCIGVNLVVVSAESISLHYAPIADILAGTETWAEVTTGFVAGGAPRAIIAVSAVKTWIVGAGGYVYSTDDPTSGVDVQDAGSATAQDLNDIHALDENNAVAVGASNAVIFTQDGETWQAVTGPAVGVALNTVWMKSEREWLVGTATGLLYYTTDYGATWTLKGFPGSGSGVVRDIKFYNNTIGYMAHSTTAPAGRILRTIDGGNSWYVMPEKTGLSLPTNDWIGALALCADPNILFGGGLGADGSDGVIVKGSAPYETEI